MSAREFQSFDEFYPYYLSQHRDPTNRALHQAGTIAAGLLLGGYLATGKKWMLLAAPLAGYGLSWAGHFFYERNEPAAFHNPLYSLRGDLRMTGEALRRTLARSASEGQS